MELPASAEQPGGDLWIGLSQSLDDRLTLCGWQILEVSENSPQSGPLFWIELIPALLISFTANLHVCRGNCFLGRRIDSDSFYRLCKDGLGEDRKRECKAEEEGDDTPLPRGAASYRESIASDWSNDHTHQEFPNTSTGRSSINSKSR